MNTRSLVDVWQALEKADHSTCGSSVVTISLLIRADEKRYLPLCVYVVGFGISGHLYHTNQITWSLIIHTRSHDHNNSPTPLLLTSWLLLATVLLVSMVTPNNKQLLLVQYTILLYSIMPYTAEHMRGRTFANWIVNLFPQTVALSIGNISLYIAKMFLQITIFHLKHESFPPRKFCYIW